jgi:hypothetical protein
VSHRVPLRLMMLEPNPSRRGRVTIGLERGIYAASLLAVKGITYFQVGGYQSGMNAALRFALGIHNDFLDVAELVA